MKNLLKLELEKLGLADKQFIRNMNIYLDELEFWNPKYGLVNEKKREDIISRHITDSLSLLSVSYDLPEKAAVADIGSGAGLPGIPLAICKKDWDVTLIERSGKRARFLNNVIFRLSLENLRFLEKSVEDVLEKYDLITFRAFTPLSDSWFQLFNKILSPGGIIAAYKGKRNLAEKEWSECVEAKKSFKADFEDIEDKVNNKFRTMVIIERLF